MVPLGIDKNGSDGLSTTDKKINTHVTQNKKNNKQIKDYNYKTNYL